ncbi:MAG: transcriptional repressor NrdR [Phyllobacteriaceae bacterium]|nr:transcriptional repressor NrdR [Phyllobacteriaceae bacterium]
MRCPFCQSENTSVKDSRPAEDFNAIRRRRNCLDCGGRFTTFERVQLRELTVLKRSGKRVPFDRDKLARSVMTALRKREWSLNGWSGQFQAWCASLKVLVKAKCARRILAAMSVTALKGLDDVAYVRFASVYHNFQSHEDFQGFLTKMDSDDGVLLPDDQE